MNGWEGVTQLTHATNTHTKAPHVTLVTVALLTASSNTCSSTSPKSIASHCEPTVPLFCLLRPQSAAAASSTRARTATSCGLLRTVLHTCGGDGERQWRWWKVRERGQQIQAQF